MQVKDKLVQASQEIHNLLEKLPDDEQVTLRASQGIPVLGVDLRR